MKVEIKSRKKIGKSTNMWKLNNIHLSNQWVKEESQGNVETIWRQVKTKFSIPKLTGYSKSSRRREVIVLNAYINKEERSQINTLTYLK